MNEIQAHIVQLLGELDELCIENQIPYVLYGRTAKDACVSGTFCGEYMSASILVPGECFPILERLIQERFADRRSIEWVVNNPAFPGMHMRYVDEETVFIYGDSAHRYCHKGIYVSIERARYIPSKKISAKVANWIDKVIEYTGVEDITALSAEKQRAIQMMRLGVRCFGHERTIRALLYLQKKLTRNHGKQMAVIRYLKDNLNFSADYLKILKRIWFAGHSFFVPKKYEDYLNLVYGKKWKVISPKGVVAPHLLVVSTKVSYRDLEIKISKEDQMVVSQLLQKRHLLSEKMSQLKAEVEQYWNILFMTQCRFDLYRKYYPRKKELLLALEQGKYEILLLVMKEALDSEEKYLKLSQVISLDPEIDQLIIKLMSYQGKYELVQKMKELLDRTPHISLKSAMPLNSHDNDEFWPKRVNVNTNGDIPVYFRDSAGREYPVMWRIGNELRELLRRDKNNLVASVGNGEIVVQDGKQFFSLEEVFEAQLRGAAYVALMQRDFLNRELLLAVLMRTGVFYPTTELDANLLMHPVELPRICHINPDLTIPAQICVRGQMLGEALWQNKNGYTTPVLALGVQEKICIVPHYSDAKLVYRDEVGKLHSLQKAWYSSDFMKPQFLREEKQPLCSLVQQEVFGRQVMLAAVLDSGAPTPCGRISTSGVFREEIHTAEEYVIYMETAQRELMPLSKVRCDGEAVPTIYASLLQEVDGVDSPQAQPSKEWQRRT